MAYKDIFCTITYFLLNPLLKLDSWALVLPSITKKSFAKGTLKHKNEKDWNSPQPHGSNVGKRMLIALSGP